MMHDITADFVYMRLHGDKTLYQSGYSGRALEKWAQRIEAWHGGDELPSTQKISKRRPPTFGFNAVHYHIFEALRDRNAEKVQQLMEEDLNHTRAWIQTSV